MKRAAVTALDDFVMGFFRGGESVIAGDCDIGIEDRIQLLNAL